MARIKRNDLPQYIIGILLIGFVAWQLIGYLLPDQTPTYTAQTFLKAVSDQSGGKIPWDTLKKISFTKKFQLLDSTGHVEIDRSELHAYDFSRDNERLIQWKADNLIYNLVQRNEVLYQNKNGQLDSTVTAQALQNKLNAATFVLGLPFTLDTPDATLSYEGVQTFEDAKAHSLKVTFNGSNDKWYLYYSEKALDWLGYWVHTSDHFSLVINESMTVVEGFTLSRKRKSYRTNAQKEKLYLRATYSYENYQITP